MTDITSHRWLWLKFGLFIVLGLLSGGLALAMFPSVRLGVLMVLCVWAFSRAYYFAFYVIEHYMDGAYWYAGLTSFVKYMAVCKRDQTKVS